MADYVAEFREDPDLLKPIAVCRMLGVSRSWLYAAAQSGRIPCVRLGGPDGPVRFIRSELYRWIAEQNPYAAQVAAEP